MKLLFVALLAASCISLNNATEEQNSLFDPKEEELRASLDPFVLETLTIDFGTVGSLANVSMTGNATVKGLMRTTVRSTILSLGKSSLTIYLWIPSLTLTGSHTTTSKLGADDLNGQGTYSIALNNVQIQLLVNLTLLPKIQTTSQQFIGASVGLFGNSVKINGFGSAANDAKFLKEFSAGLGKWIQANNGVIDQTLQKILQSVANSQSS